MSHGLKRRGYRDGKAKTGWGSFIRTCKLGAIGVAKSAHILHAINALCDDNRACVIPFNVLLATRAM